MQQLVFYQNTWLFCNEEYWEGEIHNLQWCLRPSN